MLRSARTIPCYRAVRLGYPTMTIAAMRMCRTTTIVIGELDFYARTRELEQFCPECQCYQLIRISGHVVTARR